LTSEAPPARRPGRRPETSPRTAPGRATRAPQLVTERFGFEPHNCFACGTLNRNGLNLALHVDGGRCWTSLAIQGRFQGWDEIAHGGIVATILDEVMAWSLVDHDNWGLTARMTVDYKRPVPLDEAILAEGWVVEARRRLITTAGRITKVGSGELLATAEATYVAAPEARKQELKRRYGYRPLSDVTEAAR
jgi:acyl-coenzyme A thioesterase PaaI-like protein